MRSRGSAPIAENMSAYFVTCSVLFFVWLLTIFRYLQKYGGLSICKNFLFEVSRPDPVLLPTTSLAGSAVLLSRLAVCATVPRPPAVLLFLNSI